MGACGWVVDTFRHRSGSILQGLGWWPTVRLSWAPDLHSWWMLLMRVKLIADRWAWELVPSKVGAAAAKIPGTASRFHGNSVSRNNPCKHPPTSTLILKEFQWRNLPGPPPTTDHFLWGVGRAGHWISKIGNQRSDPQSSTEQENCQYGDWPKQWFVQY